MKLSILLDFHILRLILIKFIVNASSAFIVRILFTISNDSFNIVNDDCVMLLNTASEQLQIMWNTGKVNWYKAYLKYRLRLKYCHFMTNN